MDRFSNMTTASGLDPNIAVRTNLYSAAVRTITHEGLMLGVLTPAGAAANIYFLDSYWAQALVSLGILGTLCVGVVALNALVKAGMTALRPDGEQALLGLAIFLGLLMALLRSVSNAGFLYSVAVSTFLVAAAVVPFRTDVDGEGTSDA